MVVHRPTWFSDDYVMISTAPTCGLTKGGRLLKKVDPATGRRLQTVDPETKELVDQINDVLLEDMTALSKMSSSGSIKREALPDTISFVPTEQVSLRFAVPVYYDKRLLASFYKAMERPEFTGFGTATLGELENQSKIILRKGHGSPSQEQRVGEVPYIKVSDLRAGFVNINPTNRVPTAIAERYWRGPSSGLQPFDLLSPERTSKNIGDFCVLMPGQEQVLMTKEIIVLRKGPKANFDQFYLLWALTLKVVRDQWKRVVFMQTNREDVGKRFLEIEIPIPPDERKAVEISEPFRSYYTTIATARQNLQEYLALEGAHHFFVSGGEGTDDQPLDDEVDVEPMQELSSEALREAS